MHLLIPFAAPPGEFPLPPLANLQALLARCETVLRDDGDALSFTPPHERALARALGFAGGDGRLPWAAWHATADGVLAPGAPGHDLAWGALLPAHWHVGTDQVSLVDPAELVLSDADSRTLFDAVRPLYTSEGFVCVYARPLRWYLAHESLAELRTASPERVIGRNVDPWLAPQPGARLLRRLQNEVQMLLYTHPLNEAREAAGRPTVNSVWLWGCGTAQAATGTAPTVDERLRGPALAGDAAAWCRAWETLDEGPLAALRSRAESGSGEGGAVFTLTLAGERSAVTLSPAAGSGWQRITRRVGSALRAKPDVAAFLRSL